MAKLVFIVKPISQIEFSVRRSLTSFINSYKCVPRAPCDGFILLLDSSSKAYRLVHKAQGLARPLLPAGIKALVLYYFYASLPLCPQETAS